MKERPIMFSAPMVRAILAGQKTVTRRVTKVQPRSKADIGSYGLGQPFIRNPDVTRKNPECPYGRPGYRMWVRKGFGEIYEYCDHDEMPGCPTEYWHIAWKYRADGDFDIKQWDGTFTGWKPSIHMPREACRILLEITSVRVERLRDTKDLDLLDDIGDMLEDDQSLAYREFSRMESLQVAGAPLKMIPEMYGYRAWWDKANGHGSFDSNPWVWVVEFKRVMP